jgi:hypothetical protein
MNLTLRQAYVLFGILLVLGIISAVGWTLEVR